MAEVKKREYYICLPKQDVVFYSEMLLYCYTDTPGTTIRNRNLVILVLKIDGVGR